MTQIKNYFKKWDISRIIKLVLGSCLGIAYFYNHESLFLFAGIMLSFQAVFNIGCPGGNCSTNYSKDDKPIIKVDKYEPNK